MPSEQNLESESSQSAPTSSRTRWWQQPEKTESSRNGWWQQDETTEVRKIEPPAAPVKQVVTPSTPFVRVAPAGQTTQTVPVAVAVAPHTPLDIGEELEAEARRRALAESRGERLAIFADNRQNVRRLRNRMRIAAVMVALYGILALMDPTQFLGIWMFLILECVVLYSWMKRRILRQTHPVLTLTDSGIEVHSIGHDLGLIHWSEIATVRAFRVLYRSVGITPRDTGELCARLTRRQARMIKVKSFLGFKSPISISEQYLPISADALVAKIEAFRAARGV